MQTITDPRLMLCDRRAVLQSVIAKQQAALAELGCGCGRGTCMDEAAREQLATLIRRNARSVSDLTDLITDYPRFG